MLIYQPIASIQNAAPVGLLLSRSSTQRVAVSPGVVPMRDRFSNTFYSLCRLTSALSKDESIAWSAGNNAGGRFSPLAAGAGGTTHFFLIRDRSTGVVDAGFDTSVNGLNIPTTYDIRLLGSFRMDGSGFFRVFLQIGNFFSIEGALVDLNTTNLPTSTLVVAVSVPQGVITKPQLAIAVGPPTATAFISFGSATGLTYAQPMKMDGGNGQYWITSEFFTDTARQIRVGVMEANTTMLIKTLGYYHPLDFYW